jgi:hypothetical protein
MDPELQKKIDAARADGYTDEEIQDYLQRQQARDQVVEQAQQSQTIPAPEIAPYSGMDRSEEYTGLAQGMGADALQNILKLAAVGAGAGAGVYGAKKLVDRYTGARSTPAAPPAAPAAPVEMPKPPAAPPGEFTPFGTETESQRKFNERLSRPEPQTRAGQLLDKTTQMVRQLAANKLLQNTARIGGTAASLALYPSSLGPPVPQSGPYRGMEMNPNTGRPWTRQELEALR